MDFSLGKILYQRAVQGTWHTQKGFRIVDGWTEFVAYSSEVVSIAEDIKYCLESSLLRCDANI